MATSTMQATNGGSISWKPLTVVPLRLLGDRWRRAEGADQLSQPQVDEVEVGVDARLTADVRRHDYGRGAGALGDLEHLTAVVVVGGQQHLHVPLLHRGDDLLDVPRRRRNAGLGLDVVEAGNLELAGEIVPLLVVAGDDLAADRQTLLQPAPQPIEQRAPLKLLGLQEVEELALASEDRERGTAAQADELVPVERAVNAVFEVLLPGREVVRVGGIHALQPREDVAGDLNRVKRLGPDVRVAEHVNVALGPREA